VTSHLPVIRTPATPLAPLPRAFFRRDALVVARALIGCLVVREGFGNEPRIARIVETEAYRGPRDRACHARAGLTKRTRSLLGEEGHAYVFLVYGMHDCFNVTCAQAGAGHAVLVRAGEPLSGFEGRVDLGGPGLFARGLGITRAQDGHDLTLAPLYLCGRSTRPSIGVTARVGVGYAGAWAERPWRFLDRNSLAVSRPAARFIGRG
jgi:DNA-3-methyladenine glycosylase